MKIRGIGRVLVAIIGVSYLIGHPIFAKKIKDVKGLSYTVSGGVSLGAYQSGLLYFGNTIVNSVEGYSIKIVTGASAGGINSLLSVIDYCSLEQKAPSESVYWKSWIPLGIDTLYDPKQVGKYNLFTRDQVELILDMMQTHWNKGLRKDCDVVMSVSVTRSSQYDLPVKGKLKVPRLAESFSFRIIGRGKGKAPLVENFPFPDIKRIRLLLPFNRDDDHNFGIIRNLLSATAAFPLAFAPVPIDYCFKMSLDDSLNCEQEDTRTDTFLDGGVFDNGPIRKAFSFAGNGLVKRNGELKWSLQGKSSPKIPNGMSFLFVDTNLKEYPMLNKQDTQKSEGIFQFLYRFLNQFISTARSKEVAGLIEQFPHYADILVTTKNHLPLASEPLIAFNGFFETDFRKFDFYVGMYDAYRNLKAKNSGAVASFLEEFESEESWQPFFCILEKFEQHTSYKGACDRVENQNFITLLEVSLDRLAYFCTLDNVKDFDSCYLSKREVVKNVTYKNDFQYFIDLLSEREFKYHDLKNARKNPRYAIMEIQDKLSEMNHKLAEKQPDSQGFALETIFKPALNFLKYTPSPVRYHLSLGSGTEFGVSRSIWAKEGLPSQLRYEFSLLYQGQETLFGKARPLTAFTAISGLEYEPGTWADEYTQYAFGIRGGYQFSSGDDFGTTACVAEKHNSFSYGCSQWVVGPTFTLTLLERLRFHLFGQFFIDRPAGTSAFQSSFFFGYQFFELF